MNYRGFNHKGAKEKHKDHEALMVCQCFSLSPLRLLSVIAIEN